MPDSSGDEEQIQKIVMKGRQALWQGADAAQLPEKASQLSYDDRN